MPSRLLGFARTSGGDNLPIRVGSDGAIDGTGDPLTGEAPAQAHLLFGRTAAGNNVPVLCDVNGKLNIVWS
jgi:hypothetical protein